MKYACEQFDLLSCGIALILFLVCPLWWQRILLSILFLWSRRKQWITLIIIGVLLFILSFQQITAFMPSTAFVTILEIHPSYVIADTGDGKTVIYGLEHVSFDDIVYVKGSWEKLHTNHNFNQFAFDDYMARRKIYFCMQAEESYIVNEGTTIRSFLYRYVQSLPQKHKELLNSMLFGITVQDVNYFLQASGLHIATFAYVLNKCMKRRYSKFHADCMTCVFLLGMGCLFGFFDALFRVVCFRLSTIVFKRQTDQIGASILLVLTLRSYLATEITFLLPLSLRLIAHFAQNQKKCFLFTFPVLLFLQLCYFHEFQWLQTLLFQPFRLFSFLLYIFSLISLVIPNIYPFILVVYDLFEYMTVHISFLSYHYVPSILWMIIWLMIIYQWIKRPKKTLVFMMVLLLLYGKIEHFMDPFFEVTILDVGQGDCALIVLPYHQGTIMIDVAGNLYKNIPEDIIVPVLKDQQINQIDVLIITHDDLDHSGGYDQLSELVEIHQVVTTKSDLQDPLPIYTLLQEYVGEDKNEDSIISWFAKDDIAYLFMGDAGIPAENVLLDTYKDLPCTILKLGHHGSDSSSSLAFLHAMHPQLALISVGEGNRYQHPSSAVLDALERECIPYFMTAKDGAIRIRSSQLLKYVTTERGDFVIINER